MFGFEMEKEKEEIVVTAIGTVSQAMADYRAKTGKTPTEMVLSESFSRIIGEEFSRRDVNGDGIVPPVLLSIPTTVDKHTTVCVVMR